MLNCDSLGWQCQRGEMNVYILLFQFSYLASAWVWLCVCVCVGGGGPTYHLHTGILHCSCKSPFSSLKRRRKQLGISIGESCWALCPPPRCPAPESLTHIPWPTYSGGSRPGVSASGMSHKHTRPSGETQRRRGEWNVNNGRKQRELWCVNVD